VTTPYDPAHAEAHDHPDLARLADHDAGLLDDPALARHIADCPRCAAAIEALAATHADLAALPAEAMPDDVAERIDTALANARAGSTGSTVVPLGARRRWWNPGTIAGAAAAVAVVALAVGVALNHSRSGNSPSADSANGGLAALPQANANGPVPPITNSGRTYTQSNVAAAIPALLEHHAPVLTAADRLSAAPPASGGTAKSSGSVSPKHVHGTPAPSRQEFSGAQRKRAAATIATSPAALRQCATTLQLPVQNLLGGDLGKYNGKPAVALVFADPDNPAKLDVYMVKPSCPGGLNIPEYTVFFVARP
jgi:hypothetical protein